MYILSHGLLPPPCLVSSRFSPSFPSLENRSRGESVRRRIRRRMIQSSVNAIPRVSVSTGSNKAEREEKDLSRVSADRPDFSDTARFDRAPQTRSLAPYSNICSLVFFSPPPILSFYVFLRFPPIEEAIERFDIRRQNHRSKREDRLIRFVDRVIVRGSFSLSWSPSISFIPNSVCFETTKQMVKQGSNYFDECNTFPLLVCILAVLFSFW